ncbi:trisphosphate 5-phosphatase [Holotrichia oblita]|uniref:Trisphosphate 5-phosphatase n=1 Tax=Holotrichia oblita TaxID=644536 RepID=A0ACB9T5Z1_HOLOL|nr:trisphosphate 5-phosphatase [Holotrichia oblita]
MTTQTIPVLLVTANVGSIFEDPSQMLKIWTDEFLRTVSKLDPKFIALHCQEVGGKNYENSMKHVEEFVNLLMSSNELRLFDKVRVYLDEDYSSAENFTALGNFYFIHESIDDVLIYNFKDFVFTEACGKEIHSGNIEAVVTKEKAKFPQELFPECKWSRKGFLRTRWSLCGTVFDLVNIHLFHDASNFIAMEAYPSVYCQNRRRALEHTLQRFHSDPYGRVPYFLFGDFNFRTDTEGVIKKLTEGLQSTRIQSNKTSEFTKLQYTNNDSKTILTVGKKEFNHQDHQTVFLSPNETWLKSFDKELEAFERTLTEFPVSFPPSYPFEEKISQAASYMQTRCPAWCDRVLLNISAKELVSGDGNIEYNLMGRNTCMGDHKPVYLRMALSGNAGTINCCNHAAHCLPVSCECCKKFAFVVINVIDFDDNDYLISTRKSYTNIPVDNKLLHEPITRDMLSHDPYTPESSCSRSPCPENQDQVDNRELRRQSVTPEELRNRLEHILKGKNSHHLKRSTSIDITPHLFVKEMFRTRAMSEIPKRSMRPRLISTSSIHSLQRLQSHHSSSDEDWFEYEIEAQEKDCVIKGCCDDNNTNSSNLNISKENYTKDEQNVRNKKSMRSKSCCFIV